MDLLEARMLIRYSAEAAVMAEVVLIVVLEMSHDLLNAGFGRDKHCWAVLNMYSAASTVSRRFCTTNAELQI